MKRGRLTQHSIKAVLSDNKGMQKHLPSQTKNLKLYITTHPCIYSTQYVLKPWQSKPNVPCTRHAILPASFAIIEILLPEQSSFGPVLFKGILFVLSFHALTLHKLCITYFLKISCPQN